MDLLRPEAARLVSARESGIGEDADSNGSSPLFLYAPLLQEPLLFPGGGEPSRGAAGAGGGARYRVALPDRPGRRLRHRASPCEGPGAGPASHHRCPDDRRRRLLHRSARRRWNRLRPSLPADLHRTPPLSQGKERRGMARGLRPRRRAYGAVGRRGQPAGAGAGSRVRRPGPPGRLRRPALRAGDPPPPRGRGAAGAAPAGASPALPHPHGGSHRGALSPPLAPPAPGRAHLHPPRGPARRRRASDQAQRGARPQVPARVRGPFQGRSGLRRPHPGGGRPLRVLPG